MVDYALEGVKWGSAQNGTAGGTITWAVDGTVPANFVSTIASAFAAWSAVAKITFTQTSSPSSANIDFGLSAIDGPNNVLGVTNYSFSGGVMRHADISFDTGENWSGSGLSVQSASGAKFYLVALHEIGHALGLDHYNASTAVMNAYLNSSLGGLTQSDIDGIQALYGATSPAPALAATIAPPASATASLDPSLTAIYRFYDSATNTHFYTSNAVEKASIQATLPTYSYEGAPWATPAKGADTIDIFRFFDTKTGGHFYTASTAERDTILSTQKAYQYEGVAFEAYASPGAAGTFALERFFNKITGEHHYAADASETAGIKAGLAGPGWVDEGAAFTVHVATPDLV